MGNTFGEAILRSLEDFPNGATANEIYKNIVLHKYYSFGEGKTPWSTVQSRAGDFIRHGDSRVGRVKDDKGVYHYYLTKYKDNIDSNQLKSAGKTPKPAKTPFQERDLHPLLATYLRGQSVFAKTIYHEQSNKNEEHQKWIHPDMIATKFVEHENKACQNFFNATNKQRAVEIYSYELKKEISSDYELKKCYFQAVSNSSWANYGFLVAFGISDDLRDELERLNDSFGIGVIVLRSNPYESKVLLPAKRHELDFKTINKLCNINTDFSKFFEQIEKLITAEDKYKNDVRKGFESLCDKVLGADSEIVAYCEAKNIPHDDEQDNG